PATPARRVSLRPSRVPLPEGEGHRPLPPRAQPTVYCQHLPRYVIVRLEEEQDGASDIIGAAKSGDDFPLDEGIIFSALNALFGHSGVIDSGRHDIDPDSPLLCQNARSMDERRL